MVLRFPLPLILAIFCLAPAPAVFAQSAAASPRARQSAAAATPRKAIPAPLASAPEVIYFNGVIYTGNGLAEDKPEVVQAIALGGGKVLAVGSTETITRLAGPRTRLRDLDSANTSTYVFPGFNDAHLHLGEAGREKLNLDLTGTTSLAALQMKVRAAASSAPAGHWITGGGWDHTLWVGQKLPTRQDLDQVSSGHPVFLVRVDGHIGVANSAALAAAGITAKTPPPAGGAIDLDASGEPTGILREGARALVERVIPAPTHEDRLRAARLAIADALAHGVTSAQDYSDWEDFLVFEELEKAGELHLRISEWLPFTAPVSALERMRAHHDPGDPMLHTGMLKGFLDGSLGSRTAALKAPYADDPGNSGLPQFTQEQLNQMTLERAAAGFQIGFHAIGDRAVAMALDAFSQPGIRRAARNRIEHAQVVDPADIPRFAQLGVVASLQPNHLLTDMHWAEARIGAARAATSYPWKTFLNAGVSIAFGTDYPVEPVTPFRGLYAAVTRQEEKGRQLYYPANALTRGQALAAYTQGSAFAEGSEARKGKLLPGYDADLVLVDRDLYKVGAPALPWTVVRGTVVAGQEAYSGAATQ